MELTMEYILSQVITIVAYILFAFSYYAKSRNNILILNLLAYFLSAIAFVLLYAWSGVLMCLIAIIRSIIFLIDEKINGKKEVIQKKDVIILIVVYIISGIFAIFTYEGFFSLFSVYATTLATFANWQKKPQIYKMLGIPTGVMWVVYNIYIKSLFGCILEFILLVCSITGYILHRKSKT